MAPYQGDKHPNPCNVQCVMHVTMRRVESCLIRNSANYWQYSTAHILLLPFSLSVVYYDRKG